jgi:hypothetical protein
MVLSGSNNNNQEIEFVKHITAQVNQNGTVKAVNKPYLSVILGTVIRHRIRRPKIRAVSFDLERSRSYEQRKKIIINNEENKNLLHLSQRH